MTHSPTELRALLDRHGLAARRALGQNFVVDPNTVRRIAELSGAGPGDPVVEIGPGLGSLTLALLEVGALVTAVEMDNELVPILQEVVAGRDVSIVEADAQHVNWDDVLSAHPSWKLVANLPYNVATPLVLDLLRDVPQITEMLVMVQLEVAERLAATAPDPAIGIPSVCALQILFSSRLPTPCCFVVVVVVVVHLLLLLLLLLLLGVLMMTPSMLRCCARTLRRRRLACWHRTRTRKSRRRRHSHTP